MKTRNGDDIMGKIHLEGADNARDLGGLKTTEGAVIREKKLIRSNRLSKLSRIRTFKNQKQLYEYSIFYGKYGWGKP